MLQNVISSLRVSEGQPAIALSNVFTKTEDYHKFPTAEDY